MSTDLIFNKIAEQKDVKNVDVACAVIIKNNTIFCCKRGHGRSLEGKWEFPGGKIEKGELGHEALIREIEEELKSEIKVNCRLGRIEHTYTAEKLNIKMQAYECELLSGNLELTEHTDSKWLTVDELDSVDWADADKPIVEIVRKRFAEQWETQLNDKN